MKEISDSISNFYLDQNYPNPFDPSTKSVGKHKSASGIYFFQLKVGLFVETRKMVLFK